jgi:ABC-type multidrug transport system fused ATPase/permease subunit
VKLVWIGAFLLVFMSVANLISNRQSGRLIGESWTRASNILPETNLSKLQKAVPAYTARVFALLPDPFRQKFAAKTWQALELMILRSLLLWHVALVFVIALIVGFLEGSWARANQKSLVKMHSPMRFSVALASLGLTPVLALLWITAAVVVPPTLLVLALCAVAIVSTRNLVVHAPTQF